MDLFPVATESSAENVTSNTPYKSSLPPPAQSSFSSLPPPSPSSSTQSPTHPHQHHQPHYSPPYRFVSDAEIPSASRSSGSKTIPSHYSGYILPAHSSPDVVHRFGNYPVTESSKQTQALVGATFVQPAVVDYQGNKSIVFVFAVRQILWGFFFLLTNKFSLLGFSRQDWGHVHLAISSLWHLFKTI